MTPATANNSARLSSPPPERNQVMGYTTQISDYEMGRATTTGDHTEGYSLDDNQTWQPETEQPDTGIVKTK
jgi:hypothetical protein